MYKYGKNEGERIDLKGFLLLKGGGNDGKFWIDLLRKDDKRECVKCGNLESAELYVYVKFVLGGIFIDIVMWVFCFFNGLVIFKVGLVNFILNRIGEYVGDWEYFIFRVSNFTGELWSIYFL